LVAYWAKGANPDKILVCAPSNNAADLIAERLRQIPEVANRFVRLVSERREDVFNLNPKTVLPYTL